MLTSSAPSKLILAGEHAVLYGASALAVPLSWSTTCVWTPADTPSISMGEQTCPYSLTALSLHWQTLLARQLAWQGHRDQRILQSTMDLPLAVLAWWHQQFGLHSVACRIDSDVPMGHGLGSSASLIIAMLDGLNRLHHQGLSFTELQAAAITLENLAHGRSSGLDVLAVMHHRPIVWSHGQAVPLALTRVPGFLVNTGKPASSTADCVAQVQCRHATDVALWTSMQSAVCALQQGLLSDHAALQASVTQLQDHLIDLGVVPPAVQRFTADVRDRGWTGKQCGAGSVSGDAGGFYWVLSDVAPTTLCAQYGYDVWPLSDVLLGADS